MLTLFMKPKIPDLERYDAKKFLVFNNVLHSALITLSLVSLMYWVWDIYIDPNNAHKTLLLRLHLAVVPLVAFAALTRIKSPKVAATIVYGSFIYMLFPYLAVLNVLTDGYIHGISSFVLWLMFTPLLSLALPVASSLLAIVGLTLAPLVFNVVLELSLPMFGYLAIMIPCAVITAIIVVALNNRFLYIMMSLDRLDCALEAKTK